MYKCPVCDSKMVDLTYFGNSLKLYECIDCCKRKAVPIIDINMNLINYLSCNHTLLKILSNITLENWEVYPDRVELFYTPRYAPVSNVVIGKTKEECLKKLLFELPKHWDDLSLLPR